MDILYIGDEIKGSFVREYAGSQHLSADVFPPTNTTRLADEIIRTAAKNNIINIDQLYLRETEIVQIIKTIQASYSCRIIIHATGYNIKMDIIQALLNAGINNFIFAVSLGEMKNELAKCITGYYDENPLAVIDTAPLYSPDAVPASKDRPISVSVSGVMHRIGTTTFALQAIRYLMKNGKTACYIEMNDSGYINFLAEVFDENLEKREEAIGMVRYQGIDLYYKRERIPEILKREYDYYIYDYGVALTGNLLVSYLEKDKTLLVCGSQPNELMEMTSVLQTFYEHPDLFYLFNMSHENEHEDVLELMDDRAEKTQFTCYTPDGFTYEPGNDPLFQAVFDLEPSSEEKPGKCKRKRLFGKRKD